MIKIAIDTGGTFTDYTSVGSLNNTDEKKIFIKNPTNHQDPAKGILEGLKELAEVWNTDLKTLLSNTSQISHGTTLALNALLEKKGVKTALFTTKGFRDALELRRSQLDNQWNIEAETPPVLVPRRLRLGIDERIDYKGDIIKELNEKSIREACKICKKENIKSIAICFLFSFLNSAHEQRTKEIIQEELPDVFISLSSDVSPQIREYERTTTTVINAYVTPIVSSYLDDIKNKLKKYGWNKPINIMMNSGGLSDIPTMEKIAAKTLLSGPAGGGVGNQNISHILKKSHLVLGDMGGTSFDLHLINDNDNNLIPESKIESYPITLPMIDIHSIGAGGGSIIHIDESGTVHVGPDSAGSVPGPACYDNGGTFVTITDVLLVLGLMSENNFLGGRLKLSKEKAIEILDEKVAKPLGINVTEAAIIIYSITCELMADSLRLITMKKGNDPREYSLVSSGGAFGLFAANIMDSLNMKEVLIPVQGPVFCSWGMLGAKRRYDKTISFFMEKKMWDLDRLNNRIQNMKKEADIELDKLEVSKDNRCFDLILEMRYIGQHHELSIPVSKLEFNENSKDEIDKLFHETHKNIYEYSQIDNDWEIMNIHLASYEDKIDNPLFELYDKDINKNITTINIPGEPFQRTNQIDVDVYSASDFDKELEGPCLIEFDYTNILIPQGFKSSIVDEGILSIKKIE
ncbi:MAG: hydantoinase/oxoprolinase family protein [Methanobacteriaceae archaeon]|nr:hydantoinase/oxoprolinase family protein [Methanobacteriaceae archaeon]